MILRIIEMIIFEKVKTNITATPIPKALFRLVEIANVEHIPKYKPKTGFSVIRPLEKLDLFLLIVIALLLSCCRI